MMKFATQDALDIPADIMAERTQCELAPTVYRTSGPKSRAIAQFVTIEAADSYVAELIAEGQPNAFAIKLAPRNPIAGKYTNRGVWRESGVRQVNR